MRVLSAILTAVAGAIVSFFSVLVVMEGGFTRPDEPAGESRLGAFAMPELEASRLESLVVLRPIPTMIERTDDATPGPIPALMLPSAAAAKVRAAMVPPVMRRMPVEAPDNDAATPPTRVATETAATPPREVTAPVPKRAAKRNLAVAKAPLDPNSRSALGGPKQPAAANRAGNGPPQSQPARMPSTPPPDKPAGLPPG